MIGRVDNKTQEIVATDGRCKKDKPKEYVSKKKPSPIPVTNANRLFYGATYLHEALAEELGISKDLRLCLPETYQQFLSIAFYLILEDNNPLHRFEKWHLTHNHPVGKDIASPRSSDLFSSITDEQVTQFFRSQGRQRCENEYWAYDSTSISSYAETLAQVQYGKNKENDKLPQLNLLLVFGEKSGLPF